ncbi:hypothetical protein HNR25_002324 [Streptomonospora salina]|uniref:Uncharacterized protein n=1 Tax=Streptomonospora salina TaxID=104205 RepID=A0A841EBX6_9ACTN|nr:hypothetical protein [Streptomonospora salina]
MSGVVPRSSPSAGFLPAQCRKTVETPRSFSANPTQRAHPAGRDPPSCAESRRIRSGVRSAPSSAASGSAERRREDSVFPAECRVAHIPDCRKINSEREQPGVAPESPFVSDLLKSLPAAHVPCSAGRPVKYVFRPMVWLGEVSFGFYLIQGVSIFYASSLLNGATFGLVGGLAVIAGYFAATMLGDGCCTGSSRCRPCGTSPRAVPSAPLPPGCDRGRVRGSGPEHARRKRRPRELRKAPSPGRTPLPRVRTCVYAPRARG